MGADRWAFILRVTEGKTVGNPGTATGIWSAFYF